MNDEVVSSLPGKKLLNFTAFMYIVLGLLFLINPAGMSSGLGYENLIKAALTEVMASYGGLWIGIGVALLIFYLNNEIRIGLAVVLLTFLGFAVGRALGAVRFGGFYGLNCYWLAFELGYVLLTNHYMRKYRVTQEKAA